MTANYITIHVFLVLCCLSVTECDYIVCISFSQYCAGLRWYVTRNNLAEYWV